MARAVDSPRVVNIADLRLMAERRLPRAVFDYIDGGADAEFTLRENCRVFDDVVLRPRNAVAIRRLLRPCGHDRYGRVWFARARLPQRHQGAPGLEAHIEAPLPLTIPGSAALAGGISRRRRPDVVPQRRAARPGPDALRR